MDPIWLILAFAFGFGLNIIGLHPMVGYLIAGFALNIFGVEGGSFIEIISGLGVTLLLFTIGLKLKLKDLIRPEVGGGALIQMLAICIVFTGILLLLALSNSGIFKGFTITQALLIAFSLSFSSTVFAVKVLDERGESKSLHGVTTIGILVIQDLIAVIFLVATTQKLPSVWVFTLPIILLALKPVIYFILNKIGHGELLILGGFFLALIPGAELFHIVGLKPDLGALVMGILVANHPKAEEMARSLLSFKDLFLIGFFLSIGLSVSLSIELIIISMVVALAINIKLVINFLTLSRFGLRARTSYFSSLSLANYSEFGLIVASVAVSRNWLSDQWLGIIALSLAISFVISSPLNSNSHSIFARIRTFLRRFETKHRLLYDRTIDIGDAEILIFGMGVLGVSAYDQLKNIHKQKVLGLDYNSEKVSELRKEGRFIVNDDATDLEFWEHVKMMEKEKQQVKLVILCLEDHKSNIFAVDKLRAIDYKGKIVSTAEHEDEVEDLKKRGVDSAYNLYSEAGIGLVNHAYNS
ncbi:MAG: cation:proton antiporter [Bacteroidales bacterium]|nr:cation:proton antiporter [Bacteroidales bacterium]